MRKKILLIFCLCFTILGAEEMNSNSKKWRTFVGIEGGVGLYSIFPSAFFNFNYHLGGVKAYTNSLGYNLALQVGWQKYDSEHFGKRFTLSLRGDYMQNYGEYKRDKKQFSLGSGYGFMLSFNTDWLFDFSVQEKNRFGMFGGIGIDILGLDWFQKVSGRLGIFASLVARVGFKTQIKNNVIDLTFNIPMVGLISGGNFATNGGDFLHAPINSTLTLGYKYLF